MAGKTRPRKNFPAWSHQMSIYYIFHVCCKSLILSPLMSLLCFKCLRPKKAAQQNKILKKLQSWKTKCHTKKMSRHERHIFCIHDTLTWCNLFYLFCENSANVLSSEINDILDMFSELLFWYKYVIRHYSVVIKIESL